MKKTTLIIILGVLTICCIILGSIKHLGGTFKKSKVTEYSRDIDYEEKDSFSQKLEAFSAIKMSCSIAEIKIEEGDNFKIESQYNKEILKPTFSVKDGKLDLNPFTEETIPIMAYRRDNIQKLIELKSMLEYHSVFLYFLEEASHDELALKCTKRLK